MFYGVVVKPGKSVPVVPHADGHALHLSQASLPPEVKKKSRVSLLIKVGDEKPVILCTLCAGVQDTVLLDQFLSEYAELSVQGSGTVHITGYYSPQFGGLGDEEYSGEAEEHEDDYMVHPMDAMFGVNGADEDEEDLEEDESSNEDDDSEEPDYLTAGAAREPSVIIEDITDQEAPSTTKALPAHTEDSKKRKADSQVPTRDAAAPERQAVLEGTASKQQQQQQHPQQQAQPEQLNSQQKKQQRRQQQQGDKQQQADSKHEKQQKQKAKEQKQQQPTVQEDKQLVEGQQQPAQQERPQQQGTPAAAAAQPLVSKKGVKKFENGFEIHNTKMGDPHGKLAKAGKIVKVRYTGRLTTGKVFDKTLGNKPFAFRLGVGEVIKGWDVGVEGMRVGDVRKLIIPPQMGYGSQRTGPIPPHSTLEFEVELVDVK